MLYFDEQVTHRLVDPIVAEGVDVTTVNLLGHKGLSDAIQLHRATELGRTIVTRDVSDFVLLHEAWLAWSDAWEARRQIEHPGILVIHPVKSPSVEDWAQDIVGLLRAVPSLSNRLFSWDGQNGWQEYVDRKFHPFRMPTERGNGPA